MSGAKRMTWRRFVNRHIAPVSAVTGILIVFLSVMFIDHDIAEIAIILAGLLTMQAGVWYMANPLLTSERRYHGLRNEVDNFIGLVRRLNRCATEGGPQEQLEQLQSVMHASVEKMGRLVGHGAEAGEKARPEPAAEPH